jgi:plasmid stability protein
MPALVIRNLPAAVHDALKRIAAARRMPVETLARETLTGLAREAGPTGIDFTMLAEDRTAAGLREDGPDWDAALDSPALSRSVLSPRKRLA